ncbi:HAD hydrolase-like protein [Gulosibacter massiliensis]|uniref:HAD hydrolase-like protein n=1 Tax=Gulosibacter massiliensis TaxID=2479839 RepID=UPI001F49F73E|nr:HAD hydrolase-like protein [Gulosibacter massiliensis]
MTTDESIETRTAQPAASLPPRAVSLPHGTGIAPFTAVLWDLDGTISDSAAGIIDAMRRTYDTLRMPIPDGATLRSYVGPPIIDTFREQGLDDAIEINHALETYREIYDADGLLASPQFPGVGDIIRELNAAGMPQSTATSKPEDAATRVLEAYGLASQFDFITGATADESRSEKADVVAEALARLRGAGVDLSNVLMIGDRFYDVEGSGEHGVPATYVTWGYGHLGEETGAVAVVTTPAELRSVLGLPQ